MGAEGMGIRMRVQQGKAGVKSRRTHPAKLRQKMCHRGVLPVVQPLSKVRDPPASPLGNLRIIS